MRFIKQFKSFKNEDLIVIPPSLSKKDETPIYWKKFQKFEGIEEFESQEELYREFGIELSRELDILGKSGFQFPNLSKLFNEDQPQMFKYYAFIPFYPDISDGPQKSMDSKDIKSGKELYMGDVKIKDRDTTTIKSARNYGIIIYNDTIRIANIGEEGDGGEHAVYREMAKKYNGTIRPNAAVVNNRMSGETTRILLGKDDIQKLEYHSSPSDYKDKYPEGFIWLDKDAHIEACKDEFEMFTKAVLKDWNYITGKFDHNLFGFEDAEEGLNKIINQMRKGLNEAIKNSLLLYTEEKRDAIKRWTMKM